ncbi:MAG TPA: winged helix-turn-helix domain-containing protein [Ktedonobacteraceae bacterium]|nr:winged helix-turn-helix domain-containing protein [Ktedonobacteraceae bacterium]
MEPETTRMEAKRDSDGLGRERGAVSQWIKQGREGGEEALKAHPPKGAQSRLSAEQKAQLPALLAKGAPAYGFRGEVWTASRVAKVIEQCFSIRYSRDHVGAILRSIGWSPQKPETKASQRNEQAIAAWKTERWEALKKSAGGAANHRVGR